MKIFSSFDTKLRRNKLKEYQDHFGVDKVLLLRKSRLYLLVKVVPKFVVFVLVMLCTFFASDWLIGEENSVFIVYILLGVFIVLITFSGSWIKHIMDYYMDFALITPKSLVMFNQTGIFKRDMATVDVAKIKTILVKKPYFLYSLFNNGDLIFLSEGDTNNFGEIVLYFVSRPEEKKDKVSDIIGYKL